MEQSRIIHLHLCTSNRWGNSFGIATGYRLYGQGSISGRGKKFLSVRFEVSTAVTMMIIISQKMIIIKFLSTPQRPDGLWGSPSLVYNGYGVAFPLGLKR
jgi:hypothetical protein